LLQSALSNQHWLIATVSLLVSIFTLMSMVRLWQYAFAGAATQPPVPTAPLARPGKRWLTLTPIAGLVLLSLAIGIFSAPVFQWSTVAAQQALDRAGYIAAVQPTDEIIMLEKK